MRAWVDIKDRDIEVDNIFKVEYLADTPQGDKQIKLTHTPTVGETDVVGTPVNKGLMQEWEDAVCGLQQHTYVCTGVDDAHQINQIVNGFFAQTASRNLRLNILGEVDSGPGAGAGTEQDPLTYFKWISTSNANRLIVDWSGATLPAFPALEKGPCTLFDLNLTKGTLEQRGISLLAALGSDGSYTTQPLFNHHSSNGITYRDCNIEISGDSRGSGAAIFSGSGEYINCSVILTQPAPLGTSVFDLGQGHCLHVQGGSVDLRNWGGKAIRTGAGCTVHIRDWSCLSRSQEETLPFYAKNSEINLENAVFTYEGPSASGNRVDGSTITISGGTLYARNCQIYGDEFWGHPRVRIEDGCKAQFEWFSLIVTYKGAGASPAASGISVDSTSKLILHDSYIRMLSVTPQHVQGATINGILSEGEIDISGSFVSIAHDKSENWHLGAYPIYCFSSSANTIRARIVNCELGRVNSDQRSGTRPIYVSSVPQKVIIEHNRLRGAESPEPYVKGSPVGAGSDPECIDVENGLTTSRVYMPAYSNSY